MLTVIRCLSFAFILGGSFYFGCLGHPVEMGLAIVAGSIALAFSYIDKIQKFKGAGFEAEMRQQVETMVAKETEPPKESQRSFLEVKAFSADPDTAKVIKALRSERYTWRAAFSPPLSLTRLRVGLHNHLNRTCETLAVSAPGQTPAEKVRVGISAVQSKISGEPPGVCPPIQSASERLSQGPD